MKKISSKLYVLGILGFISLTSSCKTGSGYGCDYTFEENNKNTFISKNLDLTPVTYIKYSKNDKV